MDVNVNYLIISLVPNVSVSLTGCVSCRWRCQASPTLYQSGALKTACLFTFFHQFYLRIVFQVPSCWYMLDCNLRACLCFVQVEKLNQPNTLPNGILITTKSKVRVVSWSEDLYP